MKVYLGEYESWNGILKKIIIFYAKCADFKHCDIDKICSNEDMYNYFESYYGKKEDRVQVLLSISKSPYKRLGNFKKTMKVSNPLIRSKRTQQFVDINYRILDTIDIPEEVLMKAFRVPDKTSTQIISYHKKSTIVLIRYMRCKWIEKNELTIVDPEN